MSIMEDKTILYSVRYPSAQEEGERIKVRGDRQAAEAKLTEFLRRMREERTYEPIPGREEKGRRFAALARELILLHAERNVRIAGDRFDGRRDGYRKEGGK